MAQSKYSAALYSLARCFTCVVQRNRVAYSKRQSAWCLLILGGTPNRQIYAAKLLIQHPERKVLISSGSKSLYMAYLRQGRSPKRQCLDEHYSKNIIREYPLRHTGSLNHWGVGKILFDNR